MVESNIDKRARSIGISQVYNTILGRNSQYNILLDQLMTNNPIIIQVTRWGMEQQRDQSVALNVFGCVAYVHINDQG